jgi:hypothetical protein
MKYSPKSIAVAFYGTYYKTMCGLTYAKSKAPKKCKCGRDVQIADCDECWIKAQK